MINVYEDYPFDECCDPTVCEEPIASDSGVCPIDFTTECLEAGDHWAVVQLVDKVGLEQNYYAQIIVSGGSTTTDTCSIVVYKCFEIGNKKVDGCIDCYEPGNIIGECYPICEKPLP